MYRKSIVPDILEEITRHLFINNMLSYAAVFVIGVVVGQMSLLFWMGEIKKCEKKEPR